MAVGKLARKQFVISGERLGVLCYFPAAVGVFPAAVGNPCFAAPLSEIALLGFQLPTCRRKLPPARWKVSQL